MKKLAIVMNVGAILLLSGMYLSYVAETHHKTAMDKRMERRGYDVSKPFDWKGLGVLILVLSVPTVNLLYIARTKSEGDGWLALYFQRRAAEERARIRKIEDELSKGNR